MSTDARIRALEREAASGDPDALARLEQAVRRTGVVDAFERDLEALLARVRAGAGLERLEDVAARAVWALEPLARRLDAAARGTGETSLVLGPAWLRGAERWVPFLAIDPASLSVTLLGGAGEEARLRHLAQRQEPPLTLAEVTEADLVRDPGLRLEVARATLLAWRDGEQRSGAIARSDVRARAAMYVGSTGPEGLEELAHVALLRAIAEHRTGGATVLEVTLRADGGLEVGDDGRGLRLDGWDPTPLSVRPGERRDPSHPDDDPHREGIGLAPVCVLSARFEVEARREGRRRRWRFERGAPVGPPRDEGPTEGTGTTITIVPEPEVFGPGARFEARWLERRLDELAHLHPGLATHLLDVSSGRAVEVRRPVGVAGWVGALAGDAALVPPIVARGEHAGVTVDAAFTWVAPGAARDALVARRPSTRIYAIRADGRVPIDNHALHAFVNGRPTVYGTHDRALGAAIEALLAPEVPARWFDREQRGLVAVVSLVGPALLGGLRSEVEDPRAGAAVHEVVGRALRAWLARASGAAVHAVLTAVRLAPR